MLSLILLVGSSVLFLFGKMPLDRVKTLMLAATVIWFVSAIVAGYAGRQGQS